MKCDHPDYLGCIQCRPNWGYCGLCNKGDIYEDDGGEMHCTNESCLMNSILTVTTARREGYRYGILGILRNWNADERGRSRLRKFKALIKTQNYRKLREMIREMTGEEERA